MRAGDGDISIDQMSPISPKRRAGFKTKLLVILIMVLILSSGSLYYIKIPIFYYAFLGFAVFIMLLIAYLLMFVTEPPAELFDENDSDYPRAGLAATQNPGLENVLKAEKKYQRKQTKPIGITKRKLKSKSTRTISKKPDVVYLGEREAKSIEAEQVVKKSQRKEKIKEIPRKKQKDKESTKRKKRIGSMPLEEAAYEERVRLQKKGDEAEAPEKEKKITTFLCPDCGGRELYYEAGLISGYKYHCKDCDYIGTFVIEKDFKVD